MDKKKSRTDLLAAGRQKLQQFRQKKDNRGTDHRKDTKGGTSQGKASKKSANSGQHEANHDTKAIAAEAVVSSQVVEGGITFHMDSGQEVVASVETSTEIGIANEVDVSVSVPSSELALNEQDYTGATSDHGAELRKELVACENVVDLSLPSGGEDSHSISSEAVSTMGSSTSESIDSKGEIKHADAPVDIDCLGSPALGNPVEGAGVEVERVPGSGENAQQPSSLHGDIPDISLIHARGDQEDDGSYKEQFAESFEKADVEKTAAERGQMSNATDSYPSSSVSHFSEGSSVSLVSHEVEELNAKTRSEQIEDVTDLSEKKSGLSSGTGSSNNGNEALSAEHGKSNVAHTSTEQNFPESINTSGITDHKSGKAASSNDYYSHSISFLQLIDIVRGLGEDEYEVLCKSRESASMAELGTSLFEKVKEELFVSCFMKDILLVQLREQSNLQNEFDQKHCQLLTEMSQLHASCSRTQDRNNSLAEELSDCRSKVYAVTSSNERLENQLLATEAQVEDFATKTNELQLKLEKSKLELSEAKDLLLNLQVENEALGVTISSVNDEKKKLLEEKESKDNVIKQLSSELSNCKNSVASLQAEIDILDKTIGPLTDEKMRVVEEKDNLLGDIEKLQAELAGCKTLLTLQEVENSNVKETLSLLSGNQKKLEEDNLYLSDETEKVHLELNAHKILVTALQCEYSNLVEGHSFLKNESQKFQEEMEHLAEKNNILSVELLTLQERLSTEQVERTRLAVDLDEVLARMDKLAEENTLLSSSLEANKTKMREIDDRDAQGSSNCEMPGKISGRSEVRLIGHGDTAVPEPTCQRLDARYLGVSGHSEEIFYNSSEFSALKEQLEKGVKILQNLEKAIEQIHSHSSLLNRSSSKSVAPGVSKLIQAFEPKRQHEEQELEETPLTGDQSETDPFVSVKRQIKNLSSVFEQLVLNAGHASTKFKGVHDDGIAANEKLNKLDVQFRNLREHCNILEADNIESKILFEAAKQYAYELQAKQLGLEVLCESLNLQNDSLGVKNSELNKKLNHGLLRIDGIEIELETLQQSLSHMASSMQVQLEGLQEESEKAMMLEHDLTSSISEIAETVGRLDDCLLRFYSSSGAGVGFDLNNHIADSVNVAIKVIDSLEKSIEAVSAKHESSSNSYKELKESFNTLLEKNERGAATLHKVYAELRKFVTESRGYVEMPGTEMQSLATPDPFNYGSYENLMELVGNFVSERVELQSANDKLQSELSSKRMEIEELTQQCLGSSLLQKLAEKLEGVVELENSGIYFEESPGLYVELLVSSLVQKFRGTEEQADLFRKQLESKEMELMEIQSNILQHNTEIGVLRESLSQAEESLSATRSEWQEKSNELEQSEQRLLSIREKLSIAVAKGKGLVVQRDNLKQSLAETSAELERCSEEIKLKDARLQEVEAKLKTHAEAGERVEALESELSYIRNSATALRESFLIKDSLLHRIEEILEDLDLPEHFHSRDILERIEWLARSATGNSMPLSDWDQKSSDGVAGFVITEPWREDAQPSTNSGDDLRIKFEELQGKFYGLAEQNEMLEQSLMQRNNLVQRWEELLGKIYMPPQLQSLEVEDKIEWLGSTISEAIYDRDTLQRKIDNLENYCRSLSADLEVSRKRVSDFEADLQSIVNERDDLLKKLETLQVDHEKLSAGTVQLELKNEKLQNQMNDLQEKLAEKLGNEEHLQAIEGEMMRLKDLIGDAMKEDGLQDLTSAGTSETLEGQLRKLIEYYQTFPKPSLAHETDGNFSEVPPENPGDITSRESVVDGVTSEGQQIEATNANPNDATSRDIAVTETPDLVSAKEGLEEALHELKLTREERDVYMEKQQSLVAEVEALDEKRMELQELLSQEEKKSASVREKLNVAVRKGKSLVQQRDSLKQTVEEMTTELGRLKLEINSREDMLGEREKKIRELASYPEKVEALDAECQLLKNHLKETESLLKERSSTLSMTLNVLSGIDIGDERGSQDLVWKVQRVSQLFQDMQTAVASAEQESTKSRRAAELLLAELNEVQDRNDSLQEELAKSAYELQQLSRQKEETEAAKVEALSRLEKLYMMRTEERRKQYSELITLRTSVDTLRSMFTGINKCLADVFSKDLEFLHHLEASLESCAKQTDTCLTGWPHPGSTAGNFVQKENFSSASDWSDISSNDISGDSDMAEICGSLAQNLHEFTTDVSVLQENISKHLVSWHEQVNIAFGVMDTFFKSLGKGKDSEIASLHERIALLHGACSNVLVEIENKKAELVGNGDLNMGLDQATRMYTGVSLGGGGDLSSMESGGSMVDRLSFAVKDFVTANVEVLERNQKEMKTVIANLQRELQEKDAQRDRMCTELVGQIKEAQASARNYAADLQSVSARMHDTQKQLEALVEERDTLEERVKELQNGQASSAELQEKVKSLGDLLGAKEQEIEVLMQALDEEETQMEDLKCRVEELEQEVQRKNLDLQNAEASRGKVAKKLSVTMSKFDELHHLSENLLAEIEKLQQQLQDRDAEVSFLRQEVTRCTNEVLVTSQMSTKRDSDEIKSILSWFGAIALLVGLQDSPSDDNSNQMQQYMEVLEKKIASMISELDELRLIAQSKDTLLEAERSRVAELRQREENLEQVLHEKESQVNLPTSSVPEIVEVEPVINKWTVSGTSIPSQVRSLRKGNNDQVAISIDADQADHNTSLEDDDDKAHGFRSLSTSRIVPRFTRPVTDMIDGLWVSCDRTLMRQPALRLSIMIYWAILHTLLAAFVV